jgi:hypothetical protein
MGIGGPLTTTDHANTKLNSLFTSTMTKRRICEYTCFPNLPIVVAEFSVRLCYIVALAVSAYNTARTRPRMKSLGASSLVLMRYPTTHRKVLYNEVDFSEQSLLASRDSYQPHSGVPIKEISSRICVHCISSYP